VARYFTGLSACVKEIRRSRIFAGLHFEFDNLTGKRAGRAVAEEINADFLLSKACLPALSIESISNGVPYLGIHGRIGTTCILEASSDLTSWHSVFTHTAGIGGFFVQDSSAHAFTGRFYKIRAQQSP
jgi:hypothetical protein